MTRRSFASDNNAGVHPEVIEAITNANDGHVIAYGSDPITARAVELFQKHFGDVAVFFVFGGTGAKHVGMRVVRHLATAIAVPHDLQRPQHGAAVIPVAVGEHHRLDVTEIGTEA